MVAGTAGGAHFLVCTRCFRPLNDCPTCRNERAETAEAFEVLCDRCESTGYVCERHDGRWQ